MGKTLKWIGIGVGGLVALLALVIGYITATFNPNDYKADISKAVKEKTGRTLSIKGDLGLSVWPSIGMKLGQTSLSERNSEREFASVANAVVSVKVMPLLSKEVIVDAVEVTGLRTAIVRDKAGKLNFEDLTDAQDKPQDKKTAGAGAPVKVDIAKIQIEDADITFADQAAGTRYRLSKMGLKTGRIASGVTTPVDFSATIASEKDKTQLDTKLKAKLTFDLDKKLYRLADLDATLKGDYAGITGMTATAKGSVGARLDSGEYIADALALAVSGKRAGADLNVKVDAPKLTLTKEKVDGGKIVIEAKLEEAKEKLTAKVTLGGVHGAFKSFTAGPLEAHIEMAGDGRQTKINIASGLNGDLEAKRFDLPKLAISAKVIDPKLPKGAFDAAITGNARADLTKETAALDFSGRLDESSVNGKVGVTDFSPLAVTFDLNADQLDVDRLLGKAPGKDGKPKEKPAPGGPAKDDKIDLSALKNLNVAGSVKVGKLTLMNLKGSQARADIKVAGGRLDVAPMSAQLYQGTLNGSLSARAADNAVFAVKQTLAGVSVGPLLKDAADIDTLEGKGTVSLDVTTQGASVDALKKALGGTAAVNLADGAIKGIDIAGTIRGARDKVRELRGQEVKPADKSQKTDFSELKATFDIKNGVARNDDLSMKSPLLRVSGAGTIDIGHDKLDYVLKPTLVATSQGQGGKDRTDLSGLTVPVKLTGSLESPQYTIDFAGMVTDVAKQRLQDELLKRLGGQKPAPAAATPSASPAPAAPAAGTDAAKAAKPAPKDSIKDQLKGILGR